MFKLLAQEMNNSVNTAIIILQIEWFQFIRYIIYIHWYMWID